MAAPDDERVATPLPALFRAFPELRGRLPHRPLLSGPTPVVRVAMPEFGGEGLFVKRDDRSCPLYGGNKPRKLEFVIGAALARRAKRLVTTGGVGTHHGLATTILARAAGLATTLVLVDQPATASVRESLLLQAAYGAEQRYAHSVVGAAWQVIKTLGRSTLRGERPRLVPTGGSSAAGNLGFVSAAFELAEQIEAGLLPRPATIFLPLGSGGTAAGLVLGLKLAGLDVGVQCVLVTDILPPSGRRLAAATRSSLRLLRRHLPGLPDLSIRPEDFPIWKDQLGAGYGAPSAAALEAQRRAAAHGLVLETTYGAKCLAGLLAHADSVRGPALFWHTYSSIDVAAAAPVPLSRVKVPASLRHYLEREADPEPH